MAHLFINDIKPGMQINDVYMVTQPLLRNTTRGDLYIAMYLSDRTGKVNARMWQASQQIYDQLPSEGFVQIRGNSELYKDSLQMVVNDIQVVEPAQVKLADYLPRTEKNIAEMFQQLKEMLGVIKDPGLRALVGEFLSDADLMRNFCTAPGGMQVHHAYLGGLLEHVHNMLQVAVAILPLYPKVQRDLVLAAIFVHDLGKTTELSYEMAFSYTDEGQLLGHLVQGTRMIYQKADAVASKGTPVDPDVLNSLIHIVLAHHGEYEFGSPKLPATAEAFMVNYIDNLDARMNQVVGAIDTDPSPDAWTPYVRTLETRLFKKRPLQSN
ncbi:MAG: HD domain-containing protein [Sedimentisphaerales bacterium]|nr:HD domain-containing protein [Sedimentisphaerales bacterium]